MANAKKCDRCGKLYEESVSTIFGDFAKAATQGALEPPRLYDKYGIPIDLCHDCENSLKKWLREGRK